MKFTLKAILLLLITITAVVVDARRTHKRKHTRRGVADECNKNCGGRPVNAYQCQKGTILCQCSNGSFIQGKTGNSFIPVEPSKLGNIQGEITKGNCKR